MFAHIDKVCNLSYSESLVCIFNFIIIWIYMDREQLRNLLVDLKTDSETLLLKLINEKRLTEDGIRHSLHAQSPKFVSVLSDVRPGMFLTKEGYISRNYIADEIIAMVCGVIDNKIEVLSVSGQEMLFGSPNLFVNTDGLSGLEATRLIVAEAERLGLNADAAVYCQNFTVPGLVKQGDAFLLSKDEIIDMIPRNRILTESDAPYNEKSDIKKTMASIQITEAEVFRNSSELLSRIR